MSYDTDGWRTFATELEADDYCALTWADIIHEAPITRIPPEYVALKEALDAAAAAAGDLRSVPGDVIRSVSVVPLRGLDHTGTPVDMGYSRTWASPRITAAATFAVPALAGFDTGSPEPEWPPPPADPPPPPPVGGTP